MRRALLLLLAATLVVPAAADAKGKKRTLRVMTRNLYLGADLGPAVGASSICEAVDAGGQILNDVDASDFTRRAPLLAAEIARAKPDLVGLQEVALWRFQPDADFTASPATQVRYDFLKLLRRALAARGAKYRVAVVANEFDQELPADRDGSDATQDATLPLCGADEDGRLTMRDVILVRRKSGVRVSHKRSGHFKHRYSVTLGGTVPIDVDRGWVSVEGKLRGKRFRFVNTHLESFGDPAIREAQARELYAKHGPYRTRRQLITVGDFNSGSAADRIGPGYTTPGDEGAYRALVGDFGLTNLGKRHTCCFPDVFASAIGAYRFDHTVDHVFAKPQLKQKRAAVTGGDPSLTAAGGLVASDHGGLVSTLVVK